MNVSLVSPGVCHHIGTIMDMEDAVSRALDMAPGSLRALAREAGVSHALLVRIRGGDRSATPETVEALVSALERLAQRHAAAADVLRNAQAQGENHG